MGYIGNIKRFGNQKLKRKIMKHEGNLIITQDNAKDYSHITSVGYLSIHEGASLNAPFLKDLNYKSIDGRCFIIDSTKLLFEKFKSLLTFKNK